MWGRSMANGFSEVALTSLLVHLIFATSLTVGEPTLTSSESPDASGVIILHDIRYRGGDSRQWKLDLAMKKDRGAKPRPGIVVIHGGGWLEGDKSSFASREHDVPGNIVDLAA